MDVDKGRNCYSCGGFGYLAWNCRRQRIMGQESRVEYEDNHNNRQNNLNGKEDLIVLNQVSITIGLQCFLKENISCCNLNNGNMLREVMVKIGLEKINTQEGVTVEALLDSGATRLVMSLKFARKQGFKLKKLERLIYVRNVDEILNKEGLIEHTVEINIYYQ